MGDLMIGTRRPGQPRAWRAAVIGIGLLAAALVVAWFIFERSVAYEPPEAGEGGAAQGAVQWTEPEPGSAGAGALVYKKARLEWRGGVAVLRAEGTGQAIGAAHGKLLPEGVATTGEVAERSFEQRGRGDGLWARLTHELRVDWRLRFLDDGLGDLDRATVAGMVRGAGLPEEKYRELLRAQTVWDVGAAAAASDAGDGGGAASVVRALALVAPQGSGGAGGGSGGGAGASGGGVLAGRFWIGHAFSAPGLDDGGEMLTPVVTFARPVSGHAWASVGWPGSAGVATGINARGLAIAVNPARTRDVRATRTARPILLLARAVLEQAGTLDEAVRTLEATATLGAASFLVVDGRAGKWAVVERSPSRAVVVRSGAQPAPLALGDYLTAQNFTADPENDRTRRASPSAARVTRAQQLLRAPLATAEQVAAVLRDRRTSDDVARPLGHRAVPFDAAAQLAVIDPSLMVLWVADPTAGGRMRAFDLRHELEEASARPSGSSARPAPPPDLAADASLEPGAIEELRAARALLRAARRAHAEGKLTRARQLADRAVARAPSLPEALLWAGELAGAAGDSAAAKRLLQSWLDGGPDDPDREQKVRAQLSNARGW